MYRAKPPFPAALAEVSTGLRVTETTGLGGLLLAVPLGAYGVYALMNASGHGLNGAEVGVLVLLFGGAAAGVGYEVYRHRHRSVLVVEGGEIAIYTAGVLAAVIGVKDFPALKGSGGSPYRALVSFAFLSVIFIAYGLSQEGGWAARLVGIGPGVYLALLTLSAARTGLRCSYFHLRGRRKALFEDAELVAAGVK